MRPATWTAAAGVSQVADAQIEHLLSLRLGEQSPSGPCRQVIREKGLGVAVVAGRQPPGHQPPAARVAGCIIECSHELGGALVPPSRASMGRVSLLLFPEPGKLCLLRVDREDGFSVSGPACVVVRWCGRRVGGLGPGLTSIRLTPFGLSC